MSLSGDMDAAVDTAAGAGDATTGAGSAPAPAAPAAPAPSDGAPAKPAGTSPPPASLPAGAPAGAPVPPAALPPAAATAPPDVDGELDAQLKNPKGAIPVPHVQRALANARTKEAARVTRDLVDNTYGVSPETYRDLGLGAHVQAFLKNPVQYWRDLGETLRSAGVQLPSLEGPAAAGAPPATGQPPASAPAGPPVPDMVATLNDGTTVEAYSAAAMQKVLEWQMAQLEKKFSGQLQPLQDDAHARATEAIAAQAMTTAKAQFDDAMTWEGFAEIRKDVHALMSRDARYSLDGAYNKIFREKYLPGLKARQRTELLTEIKTAPPASTVSPTGATARGTGASGKRGKGLDWDTAITRAIDAQASS